MPLPIVRPFRVVKNVPLARNCFALTFVPDDGQPMFPFLAGQWIMLHLLKDDGTSWGRAAFSIASAPSASSASFELAIKVYGDFTQRALGLKEGDRVHVQGPYGVFTLKPGTDRLVMLAGGIGIAPFRCMIREMAAQKDPREIMLFYTNKTKADISYEDELRELARTDPAFHPVFILTSDAPDGWDGEFRRLDAHKLKKHLPDLSQTDFLMCGSRELMDAVKGLLDAEGVDTKARLRKELFS